jgi:hypothetical protein
VRSSPGCRRQQEFLRFLDQIERCVPIARNVHLVFDNFARAPKGAAWFYKCPHCHLHIGASAKLSPVAGRNL